MRRHLHVSAALTAALATCAICASSAMAVPPQIVSTGVSEATTSAITLEAVINPEGKETTFHFEYGLGDCAIPASSCTSTEEKSAGSGSIPVPVPGVRVEGLSPGTVYHFRVVAKNGAGAANRTESPDRLFATYSAALAGLPDGRAYEQASPIDKNGGDALGSVQLVKASPSGDAITFASTSGVPGGAGAQEIPIYLARRTEAGGEGSWSTRGLNPPASAGEEAKVLGWEPSFAHVFTAAGKLGTPTSWGLFSQAGSGGPLSTLAPYTPEPSEYDFAGTSADGSVVIFESNVSLGGPAGIGGIPNVYAWDREGGAVSLVSVFNNNIAAPGGFAGPYDWALGSSSINLNRGGSHVLYYTQGEHAVSEDGSAFFTEKGTGQLYLRQNPTQPQSTTSGGQCNKPADACTLHLSASEKTNGEEPDGTDAAGTEPAAFLAASEEGKTAFFTSREKLTDDATTGPEPKPAQIGDAKLNGSGAADPINIKFLEAKGVGIATDSEHIYWADPAHNSIGRADLDGDPGGVELNFLEPGPTKLDESEPVPTLPSLPRYLAVANGFIYWTNTADGLDEHGTIGRAKLNGAGAASEEEPECIRGASNPQGIAANAEEIYWANAGSEKDFRPISRAEADCEGVEIDFEKAAGTATIPQGMALDGTYVYWSVIDEPNPNAAIFRVPLKGGEEKSTFIGQNEKLRGIALDGTYVYWAARRDGSAGAIGRLALAEFGTGSCEALAGCNRDFISPIAGSLAGLAQQGEHLYFTINGETPRNLGNDLYRYSVTPDGGGHHLTDLTVDDSVSEPNGAQVQGLVGATGDGKILYFVANGVLTSSPNEAGEVPTTGTCKPQSGSCNLYRREEDGAGNVSISFVVRLNATGNTTQGDWANWAPTTSLSSNENFQKSSFLSEDGQTLLFRSQRQLTTYDNKEVPEFYRYRVGEPISCVSCDPSGQSPVTGGPASLAPGLGSIKPSTTGPERPAALSSRILSADGDRAFFESTEALAVNDTDGKVECPIIGSALQSFPACRDVYEWVAVGEGSCNAGSDNYAPLNQGCLYLLSPGDDDYPSFLADASVTGKDAFIFTRQRMVGQDKDELLDLYDARVEGGIPSQSPPPPPQPCETTDACHGPGQPPANRPPASSAAFHGPTDPIPKRKKAKKHHKKHKHKKKHHRAKHRHQRVGAKQGDKR